MELYRKYRPRKFSEMVGQPEAVAMLVALGKRNDLPHVILFTGESGCGKTTLARILRKKLNCRGSDFQELNCADFRGIEMVRRIRSRVGLAPMGGGRTRVWLIDEAGKLTGDAQDAFLKMLEDTPPHAYFFLATTDPQKLKKTIRTRATTVNLKPLGAKDMRGLLLRVATAESQRTAELPALGEAILDKIVEVAEGSPRKALVVLNQVIWLEDEDKQLRVVEAVDAKRQAIEIARALMKPGVSWTYVAKVLRGVDEEPESIRWMILAYFTTVLLGGGKFAGLAYRVLTVFGDNFYDNKRAGLVAACYEVVAGD